jgi:hypothetical protein
MCSIIAQSIYSSLVALCILCLASPHRAVGIGGACFYIVLIARLAQPRPLWGSKIACGAHGGNVVSKKLEQNEDIEVRERLLITLPVTGLQARLFDWQMPSMKGRRETSKNCIIFLQLRPVSWHFNRIMEKSAFYFSESVLTRVFVW